MFNDIGDWAVALGMVTALLAGLLYLVRAEVQRGQNRIIDSLEHRTRQIQPDSNGGKSLTDLHKKVDLFGEHLSSHVVESEVVKNTIDVKVTDIHKRQMGIMRDLSDVKDTVKDLTDEVDGIGRRRKRENDVD